MKKLKVLGSALAAVMGIGGAVYANSVVQAEPFKQIGSNYHRLSDPYSPADCDATSITCVHLIDDERDVIPVSEYPNAPGTGEGSYQGEVEGL